MSLSARKQINIFPKMSNFFLKPKAGLIMTYYIGISVYSSSTLDCDLIVLSVYCLTILTTVQAIKRAFLKCELDSK